MRRKFRKVFVLLFTMVFSTTLTVSATTACLRGVPAGQLREYCAGGLRYFEQPMKKECITEGDTKTHWVYYYDTSMVGSC